MCSYRFLGPSIVTISSVIIMARLFLLGLLLLSSLAITAFADGEGRPKPRPHPDETGHGEDSDDATTPFGGSGEQSLDILNLHGL